VVKDWKGTIAATKAAARLELLGVAAPVAATEPEEEKP